MTAEINEAIELNSAKFRLDKNLVEAIITVESNFDPMAIRFEPQTDRYVLNARTHAINNGISQMTEEMLQKCSIGLMQTMCFKVRELGFTGNLLTLVIPSVSTYYGCKILRNLFDKYGEENKVVVSYNGGSPQYTEGKMFKNQVYLDKVWKVLQEKRKLI